MICLEEELHSGTSKTNQKNIKRNESKSLHKEAYSRLQNSAQEGEVIYNQQKEPQVQATAGINPKQTHIKNGTYSWS